MAWFLDEEPKSIMINSHIWVFGLFSIMVQQLDPLDPLGALGQFFRLWEPFVDCSEFPACSISDIPLVSYHDISFWLPW